MALPKQLLKRTAERFAAEHPKKEEEEEQQEFGEAQKTKTVIKDIGEALAEFKDYATEEAPPTAQSSERLEKLKAAYDAGMAPSGTNEQAGAAAAPKIIDFSNVRMAKDFTQEQRAQVSAMPVLAILGPSMAMKRTEEGEAIDVGGRMRNIPLKAHKIPTQYIKTMPSTWEPPHFDEIDQLYPLIKPFSMANLKWNADKNHLEYYVLEPYLTLEQERQLKTIKELVIDLLDINLFEMKEAKNIRDVLKDKVNKVVADYGIQLTKDE